MSDWRDDEARVRGIFREVNEQTKDVQEMLGSVGSEELYICECGNRACTQAFSLPAAEYEDVRAHPRRFLVALNHENPEIERVVKQYGAFAVVETFVGEASRIPEETDPRVLSHYA